jgi:hypothetical protein
MGSVNAIHLLFTSKCNKVNYLAIFFAGINGNTITAKNAATSNTINMA